MISMRYHEEGVIAVNLKTITEAPLQALVLVEEPERRELLQRFVESTAPLAESAALQALHQIIDEINAQLTPQSKVRLFQGEAGWAPEVITMREEPSTAWRLQLDGDALSRVLIRMPAAIKERASEAAKRAGTSMNTWTVRVLEQALESVRQRQPPHQNSKDSSRN